MGKKRGFCMIFEDYSRAAKEMDRIKGVVFRGKEGPRKRAVQVFGEGEIIPECEFMAGCR